MAARSELQHEDEMLARQATLTATRHKLTSEIMGKAREADGQAAHAAGKRVGDDDRVYTLEVDGVQYTVIEHRLAPASREVDLSPREKEIVRLVAKGLPNKTIAAVLDISPWTVATHLKRIFAKLNVGTRAAMISCLVEDGFKLEVVRGSGERR